jgi:hypothetical protein
MAESPRSDVSDRPSGQPRPSGDPTPRAPQRERTGYSTVVEDGFSGWAWFCAVLLGMVGLFQIITGLYELATTYSTVPSRSLLIDAGSTAWGSVHLVLGIVTLTTAGGLAFGKTWARVIGVALAVLSALVNLAFMPASPFAATLIIALDVFVIYAITVHGGEPKQAR